MKSERLQDVPYPAPDGFVWREANGGGWYLAHHTATVSAGAVIGEGVWIGERARIGERAWIGKGAIIDKRAVIGKNAEIREWAWIGEWAWIDEWAWIGEWAWVGEGAIIDKQAVIGKRAWIGEWARIGEWAVIGEQGRDYLHGIALGYHYDVYRTGDGTLWLRYGLKVHPVAKWRERVADLCRLHDPTRAEEYERAIRTLLDLVDTTIGKEIKQ